MAKLNAKQGRHREKREFFIDRVWLFLAGTAVQGT